MEIDRDLDFWIKQINDQHNYLDKLYAEASTMNPERFDLVWTSAMNQMNYFKDKAFALSCSSSF